MTRASDGGHSGQAADAIPRLVPAFLIFSLIGNLCILVSPIFMMQVLDRVVPSGNTATLLLIGGLALAALGVQAAVEAVRDIVLARLARWCEADGVRAALVRPADEGQAGVESVAVLVRFLGGQAVLTALSLPWLPLFVLALFLVHPAFVGLLALLVALSAAARAGTHALCRADDAQAAGLARQETETLSRAAEFACRTGDTSIAANLHRRFHALQTERHARLDARQVAASSGTGAAAFLRTSGQVLALGLGAWLVTTGSLTAGGMIAASLILSRTHQSIEALVGQGADIRAGLAALKAQSGRAGPVPDASTQIGEFAGALAAEALIVPRGGGAPPRLDRVSFRLEPGECIAIIGGSGSGKTTLLNALAGIDPAPIGSVFFDESEIRGLPPASRHRAVGILPQRADLMPGSIRDNICGFDADADDAGIVAAARAAGVHGLISALPGGYDADLDASPYLLSAGQAQRVALARALHRSPRYLFLDEPNALLDADGERALTQTLLRLKGQGTTIVMVLQRSGLLGLADRVLRLEAGRVADFGARAEVLARLGAGARQIDLPLRETSLQDLRDWIAAQFTRTGDEGFSQKAQIVGAELFLNAVESRPDGAELTARLGFRFIGDTRCDLSLRVALAGDEPARLAEARARVAKGGGFLGDLPRGLMSLATVDHLAERFDIEAGEDATLYAVALTGEAGAGTLAGVRPA